MTSNRTTNNDDLTGDRPVNPRVDFVAHKDDPFNRLADNLPGLVYICRNDENYTMLYLSAGTEIILGYEREEFLTAKLHFAQLIHPDDAKMVSDIVEEAIVNHKPFDIRYRVRHRNGEWRWVEEKGVANYRGNEVESLQGFLRDITLEVELDRQKELMATLATDLAASNTMSQLAQAVLKIVNAVWDWDAFLLSVRQSGEGKLRSVLNADTIDGQKRFLPEDIYETILPENVKAGEPLLRLRDPETPVTPKFPFRSNSKPSLSLMFAPIMSSGKCAGVVSIQSYTPYKYSNDDLQLLQLIAQAITPAMERCRAEERTHAFASLAEQLSEVDTPEAAAKIILDVADNLIGWDCCSLDLYDPQEDKARRLLAYDIVNDNRQVLETSGELKPPSQFVLRTLQEGQLLILRPADYVPPQGAVFFGDASRPSKSMIWVTLADADGINGVLSIQSYSVNAYDSEDLQLVQALANHCSSALARTRARQELRRSEERYRFAISSAGAVPYQFDYAINDFSFVGEGIEKITEVHPRDFTAELWRSMVQAVEVEGASENLTPKEIGKQVREGVRPSWRADIRIKTPSGKVRWVADTSIEMHDDSGRSRGSLGILQDITERKQNEEKLLYEALHDPLTGLANRALLLDHLEQALHRAHRRNTSHFAILFLDLDRFKTVNDSLGHLIGDKLLTSIADRLLVCVRPGDTVARFAGDEFVLLLDDVRLPEDVIPIANRVLAEIARPIQLEGQEVAISASIGIAFSAPSYSHPDELLRDADNALYRAKERGRGRYELFDTSMHKYALSVLALENDLRRALEREELTLYYQPIVCLRTGKIRRFEALLRWHHPTRGMVSPAEIIPLAEETRLIVPIGYWIIEEAATQLKRWQHECNARDLGVSVNLSVRQLDAPDLYQRITEIIHRVKVFPGSFRLEITESALMQKQETALELLKRLRDFGIGLSLDDFGTGYSSLSYLHELPIDIVKIDRSFITTLEMPGPRREIVRSIIDLANRLGLGVTAEGVETSEQLALLREMQCTRAQGFLFSRPVPADEATQLLIQEPPWMNDIPK